MGVLQAKVHGQILSVRGMLGGAAALATYKLIRQSGYRLLPASPPEWIIAVTALAGLAIGLGTMFLAYRAISRFVVRARRPVAAALTTGSTAGALGEIAGGLATQLIEGEPIGLAAWVLRILAAAGLGFVLARWLPGEVQGSRARAT